MPGPVKRRDSSSRRVRAYRGAQARPGTSRAADLGRLRLRRPGGAAPGHPIKPTAPAFQSRGAVR